MFVPTLSKTNHMLFFILKYVTKIEHQLAFAFFVCGLFFLLFFKLHLTPWLFSCTITDSVNLYIWLFLPLWTKLTLSLSNFKDLNPVSQTWLQTVILPSKCVILFQVIILQFDQCSFCAVPIIVKKTVKNLEYVPTQFHWRYLQLGTEPLVYFYSAVEVKHLFVRKVLWNILK